MQWAEINWRRAGQTSDFLSPVHLALYLFEIGIGVVVAFAIRW